MTNDDRQRPWTDGERAARTAATLATKPDAVRLAWCGERDRNGGWWIALQVPQWPLMVVAFYFELSGECTGVRIQPFSLTEAGASAVVPPLTSRSLRQVPFGQLEAQARRFAAEHLADDARYGAMMIRFADDPDAAVPYVKGGGPGSAVVEVANARRSALSAAREDRADAAKGGRTRVRRLFYAQQASRYVAALGRPNPIAAVAAETNYSASQVRNQISTARRLGLLTDTQRGRAAGRLTPQAIEILRRDES